MSRQPWRSFGMGAVTVVTGYRMDGTIFDIATTGGGVNTGVQAGNWHRRIWRLAMPMIISNISVPLLGAVDTAVMGHLPDPAYLGAVAIGALIFSYVYWGFGFLRMSTVGITAQAFGEGSEAGVQTVLYRAGLIAFGLAAAILLLQQPIALLSFNLLPASDQVEDLARRYFHIRVWGAPAALATFVILGWFLGQEDARTPLAIQVATNGINIVLDLWFVMGLGWGVDGVAAATLIAEYAGFLLGGFLVLRRLSRMGERLVPDRNLFAFAQFRSMVAINRDIFIRTFCLLTAFAIFTARGAQMGDVVLAANAVLLNFLTFSSHALDAFAHAAEALVGGAKGRRDRAGFHAASMTAMIWGVGIAAGASVLFLIAGPLIIDGLTGIAEVRETAYVYLAWAAAMPIVSVWCFTLDGIFIGATRSADLRNGMVLTLIGYLAALAVLEPAFGNHGLWASIVVLMALRAVTLGLRYPALLRSI